MSRRYLGPIRYVAPAHGLATSAVLAISGLTGHERDLLDRKEYEATVTLPIAIVCANGCRVTEGLEGDGKGLKDKIKIKYI